MRDSHSDTRARSARRSDADRSRRVAPAHRDRPPPGPSPAPTTSRHRAADRPTADRHPPPPPRGRPPPAPPRPAAARSRAPRAQPAARPAAGGAPSGHSSSRMPCAAGDRSLSPWSRLRRARTIGRERRGLQTRRPCAVVRPQRTGPIVSAAVRVRAVPITLLAALAGCSRHAATPPPPTSGPALVVRTVPRQDARYDPEDYLQLVATRAHLGRPQGSAFWRSLGAYFVERSTSVILTVGAKVNDQAVGVLPLATIKTASGGVVREVKENQPLTSPLRLQQGDRVGLQASLVEASQETETSLVNAAKTVGTAASLPISTMAPGGGTAVDLAAQVWAVARAAGRAQDVTLTREGGPGRPPLEVDRVGA